jgi:hypothetical protein
MHASHLFLHVTVMNALAQIWCVCARVAGCGCVAGRIYLLGTIGHLLTTYRVVWVDDAAGHHTNVSGRYPRRC